MLLLLGFSRKLRFTCSSVRFVFVVVVQFLSGIVPLAEITGFTPFLLRLLALRFFTLLDSGHPPSSNHSSTCPPPLASSKSSSVALAFSCHSLQDPEQLSKHAGVVLNLKITHVLSKQACSASQISHGYSTSLFASFKYL